MSYVVSDRVKAIVEAVTQLDEVKNGLDFIMNEEDLQIKQQCELTLIEAPTGDELDRVSSIFENGFVELCKKYPEKLAKALSWFESPVIAAHWGGVNCNQGVLDLLCGKDIYFDVSFGYSMLPRFYAEKILEKHGTDKILFGTDTPWHTAEMEMRLLNNLMLRDEDMKKITSGNAKKLLGIK